MSDTKKQNALRLTRRQARRVDQLAIEKYQIPGIVLMENAARGAADIATEILAGINRGDSTPTGRIAILCGPGNNGGDGLAIARLMHNRGVLPEILFLADPAKYKGGAQINWNIVQAMQLPFRRLTCEEIKNSRPDLFVDALFGTGLTDAPRPPFDEIAGAINESHIPVLSIDIPSGLDCDTGRPLGSTVIRAAHTVTFVAEKIGFGNPAAPEYLGEITVCDIGCPPECIAEAAASH